LSFSMQKNKKYLYEEMQPIASLDYNQKLHAFKFFLFASILILLSFSVINLLLGNIALSVFELFVASLAIITFYFVRTTSHFIYYAYFFVFMTALVLLFALLYFHSSESTFAWIGIFPILSFFLLGTRRGLQANILFSVVLLGALILGIHGGDYPITSRMLVNIAGALIAFGSFTYLYERAKRDAFELVYHHSSLDELTGAGNRKLFTLLLQKEKALSQRSIRPFSLIMIDIDHFKNVNDRFGHISGDQVLIAFTNLIKANLRQSDLLFRWGGEEFIILLPGETVDEADLLAEKLRTRIEHHPFEPLGKLTASFGVTEVLPGESDEETIRRLDSALYRAKENGRNRVETV